MASYRIFVREFDAGAFIVKNSLGQYFTQNGFWSYEVRRAQLYDNAETAQEDSESCHALDCLRYSQQVFQGNLIVRLKSPAKHCRVHSVISHLRDSLVLGLDVKNFGYGGTARPCLTTLEVDWSSFVERKDPGQLEFSFS